MFRKTLIAAASAAALTGVFAAAHAQLVPLELEGPLNAFQEDPLNVNAGTLTVMGMPVIATPETAFVSPTTDRATAIDPSTGQPYTVKAWVEGASFRGRSTAGLIGGTAIVTGFWDPAQQAVVAEEVFSDIAENVILGVITKSNCTNLNCTGTGNGIVVNGGTYLTPNRDPRLPFNRPVDGGLFEVDFRNGAPVDGLVGLEIGAEGYYTPRPIPLTPLLGEPTTENLAGEQVFRKEALVYWDFALGGFAPNLLRYPKKSEISVLRIRCEAGDRLEVRGWVHQPLTGSQEGVGQSAATGTIRATMTFPDRPPIVTTVNTVPAIDDPAVPTYGIYRLRQDVAACADNVLVQWISAGGVVKASVTAPVDRLREDGGDD